MSIFYVILIVMAFIFSLTSFITTMSNLEFITNMYLDLEKLKVIEIERENKNKS